MMIPVALLRLVHIACLCPTVNVVVGPNARPSDHEAIHSYQVADFPVANLKLRCLHIGVARWLRINTSGMYKKIEQLFPCQNRRSAGSIFTAYVFQDTLVSRCGSVPIWHRPWSKKSNHLLLLVRIPQGGYAILLYLQNRVHSSSNLHTILKFLTSEIPITSFMDK